MVGGVPDDWAREAEAIAALLRAELPSYARERREVVLEPDAPAAVQALFARVGWCPAFDRHRVAPPERAFAEPRLAARLAEYRRFSPRFTLTPDALPFPRRLVEDDGQGVGLLVTDESRDLVDPPVLAVTSRGTIVTESDSYVRWCASALVQAALSRWYHTPIAIEPTDALAGRGVAAFPQLAPAAVRLADDVWIEPPDTLAIAPARDGWLQLAHRSFEALVHLLAATSARRIELGAALVGDTVALATDLDALVRSGEHLHRIAGPDDGVYGFGELAGVAVIVRQHGGRCVVACNPRHAEGLATTLRARLRA